MPTYRWDSTTSQWVEFVSTSMTSGTNVYVKLSGTNQAMTTSNSNRLRRIYIHDGSTWRTAYKGYLPNPPTNVTSPSTFTVDSTWDDKINQTQVKWTSIATLPTGATSTYYELQVCDINKTVLFSNTYNHVSLSTSMLSGFISIPINGVVRYFRVRTVASNVGGTSYSGWSNWIKITSGTNTSAWSGNSGTRSVSNGYVTTFSTGETGTDVYAPGTKIIDSVYVKAVGSSSFESNFGLYHFPKTIGANFDYQFFFTFVSRVEETNSTPSVTNGSYFQLANFSGWGPSGVNTVYVSWSGVKTVAGSYVIETATP